MARRDLKKRLSLGPFVLDGAMGTQLIARGVEPGICNEQLCIDSPDVVGDVHAAYIEAGSDAVIANTFGANRYALGRHGLENEVAAINRAAAELARSRAGEERYVLGDIGPSGDFLEPLGTVKADELSRAFAEQAGGLLAGGVDGFIIETMTALDEVVIAVDSVKAVAGDLPVLASLSFDRAGDGFRTMMGLGVSDGVSKLVSMGVSAVGFNCGTISLEDYVELAAQYVAIARGVSADVHIYGEPNAGKPELVDGQAVYRVSPEEFAEAARRIHEAGVSILGGCCGTTPEHIRAVADMLAG